MTAATALVLQDRAVRPYERLQVALADLADHELATPCQRDDAYLWTSDSPEERAAAAYRCYSCPVLHACAAYAAAQDESHGVWAGIDRGSTRARRTGVVHPEAEQGR